MIEEFDSMLLALGFVLLGAATVGITCLILHLAIKKVLTHGVRKVKVYHLSRLKV